MTYYLTILKPLNNKIATHIVDGDNWEAITGLWFDLDLRYDEDIMFIQEDVLEITSIKDDGKIYTIDGECNGFTIKQIHVNQKIVDEYD